MVNGIGTGGEACEDGGVEVDRGDDEDDDEWRGSGDVEVEDSTPPSPPPPGEPVALVVFEIEEVEETEVKR
jgi:hypothetical protein